MEEFIIKFIIKFHFIWNFRKKIVCRLLLLSCDTKCEILCCQDFWTPASKSKLRSKYLSNWFHRAQLKQKNPQQNFCSCIPQTRNNTSNQVQCLRKTTPSLCGVTATCTRKKMTGFSNFSLKFCIWIPFRFH